jgi:hypothetical protein
MLGALAAQQRLGARQQFARRERLGHVVVGAVVQASDLVFFHALGSQHDDRDVLEVAVGADARQQPQAGLVGQHPVQQDQLRGAPGDKLPGVGHVLHGAHVPARFAQRKVTSSMMAGSSSTISTVVF